MTKKACIAFRWKDYRADHETTTLNPHEFIRRFLIHFLPKGFHRNRHYGLFANGNRRETISRARELLAVPSPKTADADPPSASGENNNKPCIAPRPCPCCGRRKHIIEVFARGEAPWHRPSARAAPLTSKPP